MDHTILGKPKDLLVQAASETNNIGSSTCTIVTMDADGKRAVSANFGDSSFIHYRKSGLDLIHLDKGKVM